MYSFLDHPCGSVSEPHWSIGWLDGRINTLACIAGMTEDQIKVIVKALSDHSETLAPETCGIMLWPAEEGVDPRCGQPKPCSSHQYKEYALLNFPQHIFHLSPCPMCNAPEGPGGVLMLGTKDGGRELSYGNGRWACKCGCEIKGKYFTLPKTQV